MHHVFIFHILLLHAKGGAQCSGLQGLQVKACLDLRGDTVWIEKFCQIKHTMLLW